MAHWVQMRYGISWWKADRWVRAAHALESLPLTSEALASGVISIDKVVELARFATPRTEARLIGWAETVSTAAIRHRADVESRPVPEDAEAAEATRFLEYRWIDGGLTLGLRAELPAPEGAAVMAAIEARVATVPTLPGEEELPVSARRADALVGLCTQARGQGAGRSEPPPTVVVHVRAEALGSGSANGELEGRGVVHPRALERLLCSARLRVQVEEADRTPLALGRLSREPTPAMVRALRYRDVECRFPGCGARRFTVAPPPGVVVQGRTDRPGQPAPAVRLPSQAGARARMDGEPGPRRAGGVVLSRRDPLPGRTGARRARARTTGVGRRHLTTGR